MRKVWRLLSTIAVIGLVGGYAASSRTLLVAAAPKIQQQQSSPAVAPPSQALLRQYCVGCHNDRLKSSFGNLSLENVNPADASTNIEALERVVRKLSKGQMPPEGRP